MASLTSAARALGLGAEKWSRVGPHSLWSALATVVAASFLLALTRFGGLVFQAPRSFVRLALIGVWGWLGLSLAVWLLATGVARRAEVIGVRTTSGSLQHAAAAVGVAHTPLVVLAFVVASAAILRLLGPGLVVAAFVFVLWLPATHVTAVVHTFRLGLGRALAVVAIPYLLWLAVVGRHLLDQVQHLL